MNRWIADTNVLSETNKPHPHAAVQAWLDQLPFGSLYTTVVNLAEIRFGISQVADSEKAKRLNHWLAATIRPFFLGRIFGVDEDTVLRWRLISRTAQANRQPTPPGDLLIAAIALQNGCGVATRDVEPFLGTGVATFNPSRLSALTERERDRCPTKKPGVATGLLM
ncbi:MAG: type II toxin-antitoxin system VapC family toxin [Hyphomicrobiales bacterium]